LIAPALEAVQNIHPNTHLVIGGEQLQKSDVENIIKSARIRCTNHFGPTEATVGCIAHELSLADLTHDRLPIGRPITNVSAVLLDEKFNPVPTGAIGELYVLGACVTNGYLNRPDLTAQRYIRSPIANGKRMYRTGDLARVRTDGLFECHGRSDRQVKIDGYRIELDEVEQYIREIPGVRAAAVVSRADGDGRARLLAYFVAANEAMLTPPAVYSALKQSLPQYMVPAAIHMLKQFPLTRNGKVDLDALPEPAAESLSESPSRAESPDASQLAQIWMEVLGCGPIAPEDNFFEIGGHSLAAIRTMARVREHFSRGIPLAAIFEHPTLEGLRRYLEAYMASATTSPV
jgi:acyl-coenzyme A synthetase/AMP-(fatty) acid ligase